MMSMMRATTSSLLRAAALVLGLAWASPAAAQAASAPPSAPAATQSLREDVAQAVGAAQEAARAGQKEQAETQLREAAAVPNLSMFEQAVIERGRASVSLSARDWAQAIRSLEAVVASNQFGGADQLQMIELLAKLTYQEKDYLRAVSWLRRYQQQGGNDAALNELLPQALYLANEFKAAAEELESRVTADDAAGRVPTEPTLRLLLSSHLQAKDEAGYQRAMERMAAAHPKPEYWAELLSRTVRQPGFSERLRLDVYRLRLATNLMRTADEYLEMAQLALNAGYPAEALKVIDHGLSLSLLGNGKDAAIHAALRERADKAADQDATELARAESAARQTRDGDALVNAGFAHVSAGRAAKGVALMEQGLAKGNLRRPDEARLHLGLALWQAGRKDDALKALTDVKGADGAAALARLWALLLRSPAGRT